jgi:hypothetical protein
MGECLPIERELALTIEGKPQPPPVVALFEMADGKRWGSGGGRDDHGRRRHSDDHERDVLNAPCIVPAIVTGDGLRTAKDVLLAFGLGHKPPTTDDLQINAGTLLQGTHLLAIPRLAMCGHEARGVVDSNPRPHGTHTSLHC